jgi:hypothetical protein
VKAIAPQLAGLSGANLEHPAHDQMSAGSLSEHMRMILDHKESGASSRSSASGSTESAALQEPAAEPSNAQFCTPDMSGIFEQRLTDICGSIADVETRATLSEARADAAEQQALDYEDRCDWARPADQLVHQCTQFCCVLFEVRASFCLSQASSRAARSRHD